MIPAATARPAKSGQSTTPARWLAPSLVAACAGSLAAGLVELTGDGETGGPLGVLASLGFLAVMGVPVLFVLGVMVRGVVAGWQPRRLAVRLVEPGGGAPGLAAWAIVAWLGILVLSAVLFAGVWLLASETEWKAITVSVAMPVIGVAAFLGLVALAWPAVRALRWLFRAIDARWQRGTQRRSLFTPWRIGLAFAVVTLGGLVATWFLVVAAQLGAFDVSLITTPALGAVAAVVVHAVRGRLPARARLLLGAATVTLSVAAVICAVVVARAAPNLTLSIWGDRPLAGFAIDSLYNLDDLRAGVSLAELAPTVAKPGAVHPDIVLITIDTVRADHTPPYGGKAEMPGLQKLGEVGAVFDWAFSPSNVTRRSIPSMVVGLQPNRVHGRVIGWALRIDPRHVLLAERLREGGYETAGFMCCDGFWGPKFHTGLERGLDHLELEKNGVELAKLGRRWLDEREQHPHNKPLFVWMHVIEPHNWTEGAGEGHTQAERVRHYDRSLATSDQALVELLGAFKNRSPELAPIVIVTADHGEALGEHGHPFHSTDLYDSQTHVPLVIAGPGVPAAHLDETVSLVDLVPTVMELAGFEVTTQGAPLDGHSIADLATGKRAPNRAIGDAFIAQIRDRSNPGGITAVVRGPWKLIADGNATELYNTRSDPDEKHDVSREAGVAKVLAALRAELARREAMGDTSPFP